MKLYFSPPSPFARKCRIVVRERGLLGRVEEIAISPLSAGGDFANINPLLQAPALVDDAGVAWNDKGRLKLALPALDLPVSRTGLQVFYPPLFKLSPETGSFHSDPYAGPVSAVLLAYAVEPPVDTPLSPPPAVTQPSPSGSAPVAPGLSPLPEEPAVEQPETKVEGLSSAPESEGE